MAPAASSGSSGVQGWAQNRKRGGGRKIELWEPKKKSQEGVEEAERRSVIGQERKTRGKGQRKESGNAGAWFLRARRR